MKKPLPQRPKEVEKPVTARPIGDPINVGPHGNANYSNHAWGGQPQGSGCYRKYPTCRD